MGSGGGMGQLIKGLEIGVMIKVGLVLLPVIMGKLHGSAYAKAKAYNVQAFASENRPSKVDNTDPTVVARNRQRAIYTKLNTNRPPSLTRRERGDAKGTYDFVGSSGRTGGISTIVPLEETNIGFGFVGYQNMLHHYYGSMGGRSH
jgi:hypothetical protein